MAKTAAILQPNYIPWHGYFDLMSRVDEFIIYDDTQYTRRDWRNRNKIVLAGTPHWLSIPVEVRGRYEQNICDVVIADTRWQQSHAKQLRHAYSKAPFFEEVFDLLALHYDGQAYRWLLDANLAFLISIRDYLGITTRLTVASDYQQDGSKTQKLINLCVAAGATDYLSGPAAKAYIEEDKFAAADIELSFITYPDYPSYPHVSGYARQMSIVDALMHCGRSTAKHFQARKQALMA